jgi:group I intron endonuclease
MAFGIIYRATNTVNNKIYVGKTTKGLEKRKNEHLSFVEPKVYLHYAIRKYGSDSFKWDILGEYDNGEELNNAEILFISKLSSNDTKIGYNMTTGGDGFAYGILNPSHREDVKDKIRHKLKINNGSFRQDVRDKISNALINRKLNDEHKKNISVGSKGHYASKGKNSNLSKEWIVKFPDNTEQLIKGLREFCRNNNLNAKLLRRTSNDSNKNHKGFKLIQNR